MGAGWVRFPRGLGAGLRVLVRVSMGVSLVPATAKRGKAAALDGDAAFSLFNLLVLFYRIDHNSHALFISFVYNELCGLWT